MNIRSATYKDAPAIKFLLEALGVKASTSLLVNQLEMQFGQNDHRAFVYELHKEVVGFVAVHYIPQLAFEGELALISYLLVDENVKDQRIDKALEQFATQEAIKRKCHQIQVYFHGWRTQTHRFYEQQGYEESPKYYTKRLV